ncbi:MAG: hypothetical protein SWY16_24675 [Cyanobacteriota bacterium]|nr:hypothetical protein [Cyanobacteriota bacterium]
MSKRRNLKKEKASRNQAYARQFRKQSSRSYSRGYRSSSPPSSSSEQTGNDENNANNTDQ